jgi:hypothetical protein
MSISRGKWIGWRVSFYCNCFATDYTNGRAITTGYYGYNYDCNYNGFSTDFADDRGWATATTKNLGNGNYAFAISC